VLQSAGAGFGFGHKTKLIDRLNHLVTRLITDLVWGVENA
jgi:hypothetical protein